LEGLISKLDYLKDLGVEGLWLMPIFKSPSYHGYDVVDYETIHPEYGTNASFTRLAEEAHRRGIRLVLDLTLNHTSNEHPWFVESASSPESAERDWYVWREDNPGWGQPWNEKGRSWHALNGAWYYGLFWSGMPDLNWRNPAVMAEAQRIASVWLQRGADGFRLDAARHLVETGPGPGQAGSPETHAVWKQFSAYVRQHHPQALLLGEIWSDTADILPYYGSTQAVAGGDELSMTFNFPFGGGTGAGGEDRRGGPVGDVADGVAGRVPTGGAGCAVSHQP
jgi:glycosidase